MCSQPGSKYVSTAIGGSSGLVMGPNGPGTLPSNPWMAEPEPNVAAVVFDDCTSYWFDEAGGSYPIVQPFDRAVFLDAGDRPVEGIFGLVRGVAAYGRNVSFARFHPGFAWAARREFFRRFGLFDRDVCGGGDSSFVTGAFGRRDTRIERLQGPLQTRAMTKWAGGALDYLRGRAACTPGAVAHLWHGNREQRNYRKRRICLGDFAFDPQVHLKAGLSGLFEWSESSDPRLIAAVRQYFFDRKEDG